MTRALRIAFLTLCTLILMRPSFGQISITVAFPPPALPIYELPPCPAEGYLWVPGYWAWDPDYGYYWVPGTWVLAPEPGFLWTPGWWGWESDGYVFHEGFWAVEVGFYGGINYGFGYFGTGFVGGRWEGERFFYNVAVLNVNTTIIHNTYVDRTVIVNNTTVNRVSYNGGEGGVRARPTPQEERVAHLPHVPPVPAQRQHTQAARANPMMRASQNQGKPPIAATPRPGQFRGHGVVPAREAGAPYHVPPIMPSRNARQPGADNGHPGEKPPPHQGPPTRASELQPHQITRPNTGDAKLDERYLEEQQKLVDQQNKEHLQLQQEQERERQQAQQRNYSIQMQQQMEQMHLRQIQQMEQQHAIQMQQLRARQPLPRPK
jgi:hypothetical protein